MLKNVGARLAAPWRKDVALEWNQAAIAVLVAVVAVPALLGGLPSATILTQVRSLIAG